MAEPTGATASPYERAFQDFGAMTPPDPNTFLKLIWPHLDANTRALIQSMLTAPGGAAPVAVGATPAQPAPVQPAAEQAALGDAAAAAAVPPEQMAAEAPTPRSVTYGGRQVNLDMRPEDKLQTYPTASGAPYAPQPAKMPADRTAGDWATKGWKLAPEDRERRK